MNTALKDFIEVIETGKREKGGSINEGIPSIGAEHLQSDGHINWSEASMRYISSAFFDTMKSGKLRINDVLLVKDGATTGKVAYVDDIPSGNAAINEHVFLIRPQKELLSKYLFFYLYSPVGTSKILHFFHGAAIGGISRDFLNAEIKVPSLSEQEKVIRQLSGIESVIKSCKQLFAKLDTLVKSRFIEMFGDPVTNPMGWKRDLLKNLGELNRGVSKHRPRNAPELLNGPYPLVQTGDVSNADTYITDYSSTYSELGLKQSRMWSKGTLCITIAANIAKTGILAFDACFPDSVVGFISGERTNQRYIHHWFSFFQKILEEQAPQSAQKNINLQLLSNLSVTMPPIDLQNQFAAFVQQVDKSKSVLQKLLEKQELLRAALMQEYFG